MNFLIVLIFLFGSTIAQSPIEITCQFKNDFGEYTCILLEIEVLSPNQPVNITGNHVSGRSNSDVTVLEILDSNTPFVIPEIFTTFPNLNRLLIENSNLQQITLSPAVQLQTLILYRNNITRIQNGTFIGQSRLEFVEAMNNGIEEIEVNALSGLKNLISLILYNNRIRKLIPGTFSPLVNVLYLDFETNEIERLEDNLFAGLDQLHSFYFDNNKINQVSPTFTAGLPGSLQYAYLLGNVCVDRTFGFREAIDVILINNALRKCFDNYVGEVTSPRRSSMQFAGQLSIFDEFGNIIARVN